MYTVTMTYYRLNFMLWDVYNLYKSGSRVVAVNLLMKLTGWSIPKARETLENLNEGLSISKLTYRLIEGEEGCNSL